MRFSLMCLMALLMLTACGFGSDIVQPTANDALDALRLSDDSIVQVKLHQCVQQNMLGEADAPQQFYDFNCQVSIERFDTLRNQGFVEKQCVILTFTGGRWQSQFN